MIAALVVLGALGCGGSPQVRASAELRVVAEPSSASVYVEDRFVATARRLASRPARLRTGVHHVTITAQGHFPHDVEVDLPEGVTTIEIRLRPVPP